MSTSQNSIEDFLNHCRYEKKLSAKTLKAYTIDLTQFVSFLKSHSYSCDLLNTTKVELKQYLEHISHFKAKTIKRKIASIKAMYNYFEYEDKIAVSPLRKIRIKIKEPKQLPRVLDINEIKEIFSKAYGHRTEIADKSKYASLEALRDIVVIELLFATGARVSEIADLKKTCIDLESGVVTLRGKGDRERIIQICHKETLAVLNAYYQLNKEKIENTDNFLINRFSNKLSDQSIRNTVRKLTLKAGITKHITPHAFRHTFASLLLEKDVDIKYIQLLLGHTSIITTQIYTHVNKAKQKEILQTKHPRTEFSLC
jgi:integrase/recombinase XerD